MPDQPKRKWGGRGNPIPDDVMRAIQKSDEPAKVLAERYDLHVTSIYRLRKDYR